jgi:hypothetical protein
VWLWGTSKTLISLGPMRTTPTQMAALVLLAAPVLAGQSVADWNVVTALSPGTEVRVKTIPHVFIGSLQSVSEDVIVLRSGPAEETVMQLQIARIAVKKPSRRKRHALVGLAVGAGAGAGLAIAVSTCKGFGCIGATPIEVGAPVMFGLLGAIVGVAIPTGGWREIYRSTPAAP